MDVKIVVVEWRADHRLILLYRSFTIPKGCPDRTSQSTLHQSG